ncbi:hypothetical protein Tco_1136592 [Tanacetum coccineum]
MDSVDCISNDTTHIESDECFETNHDKKRELSKTSNFILIIKVISQISFHEGKPLIFIIKNQYVPFGIPLNPKRFYKDGVYTIRLRRPRGLTAEMAEGLSDRMLMEHKDAQGQSVFTIHAWRWLFEIRGPLLGGAKRRMSWREFTLAIGLHTAKEIEFAGFGILSKGDFLSSAPFYTAIRDPMLRLCHRLIVCSITGRSQAPEKEICFGEKPKAMTSGGQFVARLICDELGDTWASVASGLERQPVAAAGSPEVDEGAPDVDKGA